MFGAPGRFFFVTNWGACSGHVDRVVVASLEEKETRYKHLATILVVLYRDSATRHIVKTIVTNDI